MQQKERFLRWNFELDKRDPSLSTENLNEFLNIYLRLKNTVIDFKGFSNQ